MNDATAYCMTFGLSIGEISSENLRLIKGDTKWLEALKWKESEFGSRLDHVHSIFFPVTREKDLKTQFADERLAELDYNQ